VELPERLANFSAYAAACKDERGEAQVFCDRLFRAFGHEGYKEAGAVLEDRVKMADGKTRFADLVWRPRLLLEMKRRGEKLGRHYTQALRYWERLVPHRPRYVVLCNFEELWIYDFNTQLDEPVDRMRLDDLPRRYTALGFMLPDERPPLFENNRAAVTEKAAERLGSLYRLLRGRGEPQARAQRFLLQCVLALFAEDTELLPGGLFTGVVDECTRSQGKTSTYDQVGALFRQMNEPARARGGRFRDVRYFNGGLFAAVDPIELQSEELALLRSACDEDWSKINPAIFGTLFQASMQPREQHRKGAHYTPEAEILRVVYPCMVEPFTARIDGAKTLDQLLARRQELASLRVLDPACGSGNFLYVAYRELARLEKRLVDRVHEQFGERARVKVGAAMTVSTKQFFGIDNDAFAVELAKVTLLLAKQLALLDLRSERERTFGLDFDVALPLENLDPNIACTDALFSPWPAADVIIGNPPFQSKNKLQQELGAPYVQRLRAAYPDMPGRADYCVYWFRRAHDHLEAYGRAGLVGTNTIRQNDSRVGGLDYIAKNGGVLFDAVGTQVWPGLAQVHVSIVNWQKGPYEAKKVLAWQAGDNIDSPWERVELDRIPTSLTSLTDVTSAEPLRTNAEAGACYQGQTHGHKGFLLGVEEAAEMRHREPQSADILFPFLTANDLLRSRGEPIRRYVIDFGQRDQLAAARFASAFSRVRERVLPGRKQGAGAEVERNREVLAGEPGARVNRHHENFLERWWLLSWSRPELMARLDALPRYIVCARVTKRPMFEFISSAIHPNDALAVFPLADDYSFGVLQSGIHWAWFTAKCSTLKADFRYTSDTVFDTFPWPQSPKPDAVRGVAEAAVALRKGRRALMAEHGLSLRDIYASLEKPGKHPLRTLHEALDASVRVAYGMGKRADVLAFLLDLNRTCAERERAGETISGPGLPAGWVGKRPITKDCVAAPSLSGDGQE
jgi:SAM-dependent methyltransferase